MRKFLTLLITMVLLLSACATEGGFADTLPQNSSVTTTDQVEDPTEIGNDDITDPTETTAAMVEFIGKTIYVDGVSGDDTNDGSESTPYKTISAAALQLLPGDTLIVKDGVYREEIVFPSGTKENPIAVKAAEGAHPVVSGTDVIEASWSVYSGNIYVASFSDEVTDLFVNNKQMNLARWPDTSTDDLLKMNFAQMRAGSNSDQIVDSSLPDVDLTGARVNMIPGEAYTAFSRVIAACEPGKSITFDVPVKSDGDDPEGFDPFVLHVGNKYYVLN